MNSKKNFLKQKVAIEVLSYIPNNITLGIGTGSTINYFIDLLYIIKDRIKFIVSSSKISSEKLKNINIPTINCCDINNVDIYIDSADEINKKMQMIKGGGGALTGEKILSYISNKFICIVDKYKIVNNLGKFPLPIEIISMSKSYVFNKIKNLGGIPIERSDFITDNGNIIIDIYNLNISNPILLENYINNISGVITCGLFAKRRADIVLIGDFNAVYIM